MDANMSVLVFPAPTTVTVIQVTSLMQTKRHVLVSKKNPLGYVFMDGESYLE